MTKMYVTLLYVKCKTAKCSQRISVPNSLATGASCTLKCREGHENRYGKSDIQTATTEDCGRVIDSN